MTKALIFGAGGVGCVYGYIMHKGGAEVTAVCRTNYDVVKERGIHINSRIFGHCHYHPKATKTASEAAEYGPFDYIIVASKAFADTPGLISSAVTPNFTSIVLAQNGIGLEEDYVKLYPDNTIISGVVYLPVTQTEPGVVDMAALERFEIGTYPSNVSAKSKQQVQRLSDIWKAGGATAPVYDDIQSMRWLKVAVNAAWNPVTALSVCDDANFLRSSPMSEKTIAKIMREVGRVATSAGQPHAITEETIEKDLDRARARLVAGGKEPSMLTDVRARRPMEVEAILGNTLRIARENGVDDLPYLELLYSLANARNCELVKPEWWKPLSFAVEKQNGTA